MAEQKSVFRKVSLERLSSPEQLDQKLTIVSPIGWAAVIALAILIMAALAWGFFGIISNKVNGNGMLMYSGGIVKVVSRTSGQVTEVSVLVGDYVEKGDIIARVNQDELLKQINQMERDIEALNAINVETLDLDVKFLNNDLYNHFSSLAEQIHSARIQYNAQKLEAEENEQDTSREKAVQQQQIRDLEQQIVTSQPYSTFTDYLWGAYNQTGIQMSTLTERFANQKQVLLQDYLKRLDDLQKQYDEKTVIRTEFSGTISGFTIQPYDFVQQGSVLGNIVRGGLEAGSSNVILYVPLDKGKLIEPDMEVNISPATVNREEHGYIIGKIISVSPSSVTQEHMMSVLQDQLLVQSFSENSAVMEVEAELISNDYTVSGYQWSTPKGAPFTISPGTLCMGEIKVYDQRPIDMVVPFIKKLFR